MERRKIERAARERAAKRRLRTNTPRCATCGNSDWQCLEAHHVAGRAYDPTTDIHCRNCHRILSDWQKDHPHQKADPPSFDETLLHFLLGMADLFELLVRKLREFAQTLADRTPKAEASQ